MTIHFCLPLISGDTSGSLLLHLNPPWENYPYLFGNQLDTFLTCWKWSLLLLLSIGSVGVGAQRRSWLYCINKFSLSYFRFLYSSFLLVDRKLKNSWHWSYSVLFFSTVQFELWPFVLFSLPVFFWTFIYLYICLLLMYVLTIKYYRHTMQK